MSLKIDERKFVGRGASTDILEASARAYVNAVNRWKTFQAATRSETDNDDTV